MIQAREHNIIRIIIFLLLLCITCLERNFKFPSASNGCIVGVHVYMSLYRLKACVIITCASYYYVDCRNQGKIPKMKYMFLIRVSLIDTVGKHFYLKLNSPTNIIKGVLVLLITVYTTDSVLMTAFCIIVSPHQYLINITLYMHNIILYITFTKITFNLL